MLPGATQKYWKPNHGNLQSLYLKEGLQIKILWWNGSRFTPYFNEGGGLFSYPSTDDSPKGKLRQLFEVIPFALIFENANGKAIDESCSSLLDLVPEGIHDRSSCFFGSKYEINRVKEFTYASR